VRQEDYEASTFGNDRMVASISRPPGYPYDKTRVAQESLYETLKREGDYTPPNPRPRKTARETVA